MATQRVSSDLKSFENAILQAIKPTNLKLSGVAKVFNGHSYNMSASLTVTEDGRFPSPAPEHYELARAEFQRMLLIGYKFQNLFEVSFIMQPDLIGARWQAMYTVIAE